MKTDMGAAYGTWRSGNGISGMGSFKPQLIVKCLIPVVMAGILGVYGMIVSVIILGNITPDGYSWQKAYSHMASGLCAGFSQLVTSYFSFFLLFT